MTFRDLHFRACRAILICFTQHLISDCLGTTGDIAGRGERTGFFHGGKRRSAIEFGEIEDVLFIVYHLKSNENLIESRENRNERIEI